MPTRGIERWLAQRLSHRLGATADGEAGICAGVRFDSPSRLTAGVLAELSARDPDDDPWAPERSVWPLLGLIDTHLGEPWCVALARHLGADANEPAAGRRLAVAGRLARSYASYATQRPSLVCGWAGGDRRSAAADVGDLTWQVELWHRLRERLATPSPAERLAEVEQRLVTEPRAITLPARISVFGATRLPETQLRLLVALSRHRDVHLWLPHPSPALWRAVSEHPRTSPRRADSPVVARHPFLASMARNGCRATTDCPPGAATSAGARSRPARARGSGAATTDGRRDAGRAPPVGAAGSRAAGWAPKTEIRAGSVMARGSVTSRCSTSASRWPVGGGEPLAQPMPELDLPGQVAHVSRRAGGHRRRARLGRRVRRRTSEPVARPRPIGGPQRGPRDDGPGRRTRVHRDRCESGPAAARPTARAPTGRRPGSRADNSAGAPAVSRDGESNLTPAQRGASPVRGGAEPVRIREPFDAPGRHQRSASGANASSLGSAGAADGRPAPHPSAR